MLQTSYFKCLPATSLGMRSLASVQNQICQRPVASDHSILTTYFINLFYYAFSAWLYHHHACTSNLLTALHLHTDARLTLCTIHSQSGISIHPTSCFTIALQKMFIWISMQELTVQNIPVNLRLPQKQMWWQDKKHQLQGAESMTQTPRGLQWKHLQIYKQQIPDDSHILFSIWFYLIPVDFLLIQFNQCHWTTACRDNAISTLHMYVLLWYGCTGTCSRVRQSTRLHKLKYRVKIEWNHFKTGLEVKFKNAHNRSAAAMIAAFSKGTWTQNDICFGET